MPASLSEDTAQAKQPFRVGLPVRQHRRAALQLLRGHLPAAPTQRRATLSPRLGPSELGAAARTALAMWKTTWESKVHAACRLRLLFLDSWMQVEINFAHISNNRRRKERMGGSGAYQEPLLTEVERSKNAEFTSAKFLSQHLSFFPPLVSGAAGHFCGTLCFYTACSFSRRKYLVSGDRGGWRTYCLKLLD